MREIEESRHEFYYHQQASQWTQLGDRVTREFFAINGPRHSCVGIRQLKRQDGTIATEPDELCSIATDFYSDLLSADPPTAARKVCRETTWTHVQRRVTDRMRDALALPLSDEELMEALRVLPRHSCPGEDGLTPTFFMRYWDILGQDLRKGFQHILDTGVMPEGFFEGLIFLIPKGEGVSDDIRHSGGRLRS